MQSPVIDYFSVPDAGVAGDPSEGPAQRLNRSLAPAEVELIRRLYVDGEPAYRIWRRFFQGECSYHTVRRAAIRQHYKEQP